MKELVLNELKVYAKEVNSKSTQGVRSHMKKLGLHGFAWFCRSLLFKKNQNIL